MDPAIVPPQSVLPARRDDGLVLERPSGLDYDDPMWQNYRWVAMLDPVELSHGIEVSAVAAAERLGRMTWTATCRAIPGKDEGYAPRCSCCPLLFGEVSQSMEFDDPAVVREREPTVGYPTSYGVSLDVETGIVVEVEPHDGDRRHNVFSNEIHDVGLPG